MASSLNSRKPPTVQTGKDSAGIHPVDCSGLGESSVDPGLVHGPDVVPSDQRGLRFDRVHHQLGLSDILCQTVSTPGP